MHAALALPRAAGWGGWHVCSALPLLAAHMARHGMMSSPACARRLACCSRDPYTACTHVPTCAPTPPAAGHVSGAGSYRAGVGRDALPAGGWVLARVYAAACGNHCRPAGLPACLWSRCNRAVFQASLAWMALTCAGWCVGCAPSLLQYDNPTRPIYMYINSTGVVVSWLSSWACLACLSTVLCLHGCCPLLPAVAAHMLYCLPRCGFEAASMLQSGAASAVAAAAVVRLTI